MSFFGKRMDEGDRKMPDWIFVDDEYKHEIFCVFFFCCFYFVVNFRLTHFYFSFLTDLHSVCILQYFEVIFQFIFRVFFFV